MSVVRRHRHGVSQTNRLPVVTPTRVPPHPEYEPLVELLHGALQLAALVLPLLVVAHRLRGGPLPRRGPGDVVHEVDPAHRVNAALPAEETESKNQK